MGSAISTEIESKTINDENERRQREQLELIFKLADARLDTLQRELEETFLDRESATKGSFPGKRALRFERRVVVDAESKVCAASHDDVVTLTAQHLLTRST